MERRDEETLLSSPIPKFDDATALERVRARIAADGIAPRPDLASALGARIAMARGAWMRPLAAAAGVALVATTLAVTGVAETILTIFEPRQVVAIRVDPRQMSGVPDPSEYGTLTWIAQPAWQQAATLDAAATAAGFRPLAPSSVPNGLPATPRVAWMGEAKATFQFDEAKAKAAAAKAGAVAPPMPAAIANTTLTMTGGPVIMQQFGSGPNVPPDQTALGGTPQLVLVQARAPRVTSNGATVDELRDYALAQPGVPPDVAQQIRAIGDPVATLLIPTGFDVRDAREVTVRGTRGYVVGDETGLGSGVIWVENGFVNLALGSLRQSDLISFVNGLR